MGLIDDGIIEVMVKEIVDSIKKSEVPEAIGKNNSIYAIFIEVIHKYVGLIPDYELRESLTNSIFINLCSQNLIKDLIYRRAGSTGREFEMFQILKKIIKELI